MKRIAKSKTTSFYTGHEDFIIDIVDTVHGDQDPIYDIWLYRDGTGVKDFVVGYYKKYLPGKTITEVARTAIDYIETVWDSGMDSYDMYDEMIEDLENAFMDRMDAEESEEE